MSTRRVPTPAGVDVVPRHMAFEFPRDTPRYWFDGDPWSTHLFNALSLTFPGGERAFIDSVRAIADRIEDPTLTREVRAFIAQESHHRKEHDVFNSWLRELGLPVDAIYAEIDGRITENQGPLPKKARLAVTCALEHFTAIMADAFLNDPELLEAMHPNVRWLWVWHAIEETEHKAVAFDCYEAIGGTYRTRVIAMAIITYRFIRDIGELQRRLVDQDGESDNLASRARMVWRFWGPKGRFTRLVPAYLDYFRPGFHPWQHDNREVIARYKEAVESRAKRVGPVERERPAKAA